MNIIRNQYYLASDLDDFCSFTIIDNGKPFRNSDFNSGRFPGLARGR
ncbi:MAG: hypothetical protein GX221_05215 [Candidatus Riflebacteria bacterium]|nr:hypothetical protein [Candidatus Riflebacteria bacterium]